MGLVKFVAFLVLVIIICVAIHQKDEIADFFKKVFSNTCSLSASLVADLANKGDCCKYGYKKFCDNSVNLLKELECVRMNVREYWEKECL